MFGSNLVDRSSSLIVKIKKKKHNEGNQGERSCPAGYVVLEKPNKYGSFCEPKEGLPAPEAEKCKFGMIGTPPNDCHCPAGYDFLGYKGCVELVTSKDCGAPVKRDSDQVGLLKLGEESCRMKQGLYSYEFLPNNSVRACCETKKYRE